MNKKVMLSQARKGQKFLVSEDSQSISIMLPPSNDKPVGWSDNDPVDTVFIGRISHESGNPASLAGSNAGMSTNLQRFLSVGHEVDFLIVNKIITDKNGVKWRLGPIDPLEKFGGIYGYQAPLSNANG